MPEIPCSQSSLAAHEPMGGTAVVHTTRWLALEYRPHWESKAVRDARFPPALRAWLDRFDALEGTRIQLIRRTRRTGPLACYYADTTPGAERLGYLALQRYEDLLALDPVRLTTGEHPLPHHPGPLLWVCTHGQRDRCCARHGGRLYAALRAELGDAVWQTSHLGGHRFAATLLDVPSGLCYGRLRASEAPALAEAFREGLAYRADRLRGRVAWSKAAQAAEVAWRQQSGDRRKQAPALVEDRPDQVTLEVDGRAHVLRIEAEPLARAVIPSCGKPATPRTSLLARPT